LLVGLDLGQGLAQGVFGLVAVDEDYRGLKLLHSVRPHVQQLVQEEFIVVRRLVSVDERRDGTVPEYLERMFNSISDCGHGFWTILQCEVFRVNGLFRECRLLRNVIAKVSSAHFERFVSAFLSLLLRRGNDVLASWRLFSLRRADPRDERLSSLVLLRVVV